MKNVFIIRLFNAEYLAKSDIPINTHTHTHTQVALPAYTLLKYEDTRALIYSFLCNDVRKATVFFIPVLTSKQISIHNDKSHHHHTRCGDGAAGLLCCMLFYAIRRKDDRLTKLTEENRRLEHEIYRLNDVLEDKDFQLQDNDELIQNLKQKTF